MILAFLKNKKCIFGGYKENELYSHDFILKDSHCVAF